MLSRIFYILFAIGVFAPAATADNHVLVELFASQNCQSCPRAHRNLAKLERENPDLVILTWSVDYWDYLGGKDPMAMGESKERQRSYVDRFGLRGPYTPQVVFDGIEQCAGNRAKRVQKALESLDDSVANVVDARIEGDQVVLEGEVGGLADIWLVHFLGVEDNTSDMVNPVTQVEDLGPWLGDRLQLDKPACPSGCVLIVQDAGVGPVRATLPILP